MKQFVWVSGYDNTTDEWVLMQDKSKCWNISCIFLVFTIHIISRMS